MSLIHIDVRISWHAIFEGARELNYALIQEEEELFESAIKKNYRWRTDSMGPR